MVNELNYLYQWLMLNNVDQKNSSFWLVINFFFTEETAMTAAASRGFNETCCVLAGHGASLTAKNGQGLTPLLAAVDCNQEDMIFDLISLKV